ncbi:hypothetical protein N657DRAFT_417661 [Parathielavia appendiculata]|uniref:Uncharacterized protein n=1 Tax=Parathielavia appendiculata TaxID=2587402 RepID=A0AAN6TZF3_9PEZI|nr:hypothetical protein N657DRAFT_417661 [Parathielavia appendiculata]
MLHDGLQSIHSPTNHESFPPNRRPHYGHSRPPYHKHTIFCTRFLTTAGSSCSAAAAAETKTPQNSRGPAPRPASATPCHRRRRATLPRESQLPTMAALTMSYQKVLSLSSVGPAVWRCNEPAPTLFLITNHPPPRSGEDIHHPPNPRLCQESHHEGSSMYSTHAGLQPLLHEEYAGRRG